jgi:hypothetical protein
MAALGLPQGPSFDWGWGPDSAPSNPVQMVYQPTGTVPSSLTQWAQDNPGLTWILGNEPDRPGEANLCPD